MEKLDLYPSEKNPFGEISKLWKKGDTLQKIANLFMLFDSYKDFMELIDIKSLNAWIDSCKLEEK